MGQSAWVTKEQVVWLESRLSSFLTAANMKAHQIFWKDTYREWFTTYPLTPCTKAELVDAHSSAEDVSLNDRKKKEKQIYHWYVNHSRGTTSGTGSQKLLDLTGKHKGQLLPWQAYSCLYYKGEFKTKMEKEYGAYVQAFVLTIERDSPTKFLEWQKNHFNELLREATPEVKAEVEQFRKQSPVNEDEAADGEHNSECLHGIQSAMDSLPKTLDAAANQIYVKTGCAVAILVGGPQPRLGGQITSWFVHRGKTVGDELELDEALPDLEGWIGDFNNFVQDIFLPEICEARALKPILSLSACSHGLTPSVAAAAQSTAASCSLTPGVVAAAQSTAPSRSLTPGVAPVVQSAAPQPAVSGTPTNTMIQPAATGAPTNTMIQPAAAGAPTNTMIQPAATRAPTNTMIQPDATSTPTNTMIQPDETGTPGAITTTMSAMSTTAEFSVTPTTLTTVAMPSTAVTPSTTATTMVPATLSTTLPSPATMTAFAPSPTPPATKDSEVLEDSMDVDIASPNETKASLSTDVVIPVQWIKTWFEFFGEHKFEDPWMNVVTMWIKLEESLGFSDKSVRSTFLPSKQRPREVGVWIKNGRPMKRPLVSVTDTSDYAQQWFVWLASCQPDWRDKEALIQEDAHAVGDWLCLCHGGKNGFFMVLISLACWCEAIVDDADRVSFTKAMSDVAWVLSQMVTVGTPSTKCMRNAHDDQGSSTLRKRLHK
ncbi:hypothetical protein EV702DRAFT_1196173 [Suillus placidus]|uniref:Uncharacterized protein n=1 Tax=Suillus placidus TaxID=48579 RepID=A0A9P6ZZF1_9AGAM|nr:hypothetical protein EV702DRAFT_1196173 [Suillus placidus]